ncbi:MAG: pantetheine-phosphate adenylyltransferase [Candidatus Diapherotrites archaeon]
MNKQIAVYPGTFDPITNGHLDVIKRGSKLFKKLVVAVAKKTTKQTLFTDEERVKMVKESVKRIKNVEVKAFDTLLVEFMKKQGSTIILRGLRERGDFPFELQNAIINNMLDKKIETVFVMTSPKNFYISSSIVKEIFYYNGNVSSFVPKPVFKMLEKKKLQQKKLLNKRTEKQGKS